MHPFVWQLVGSLLPVGSGCTNGGYGIFTGHMCGNHRNGRFAATRLRALDPEPTVQPHFLRSVIRSIMAIQVGKFAPTFAACIRFIDMQYYYYTCGQGNL